MKKKFTFLGLAVSAVVLMFAFFVLAGMVRLPIFVLLNE